MGMAMVTITMTMISKAVVVTMVVMGVITIQHGGDVDVGGSDEEVCCAMVVAMVVVVPFGPIAVFGCICENDIATAVIIATANHRSGAARL